MKLEDKRQQAQEPPPECQTEAEKKAFAFGWWKAMEAQRAEKQEPVAFASHGVINWIADRQFQHEADLYTHPQPKREWVGLTDEEIEDLLSMFFTGDEQIKAIEAKLKEKNT
jgi:hypothetical protein